MARPQLTRTDDSPGTAPQGDYAPKKYPAWQQVVMGAKVAAVVGIVFGLLWLADSMMTK